MRVFVVVVFATFVRVVAMAVLMLAVLVRLHLGVGFLAVLVSTAREQANHKYQTHHRYILHVMQFSRYLG